MIIAGLQKTTLIDYPGKMAAIIFTRGCNFRCHYCHNPGLVDPEKYYPEIPEKEILDFLEKRRSVLDGVVITGGEPLIYQDIGKFLKKIKDLGYAVKLDTNGTNPELLQKLIKADLVDYIAMDIKHHLDRYGEVIDSRHDLANIEKSVKMIMNSGLDYEFRTTVLPKFFQLEDFHKVGDLIKGAKKYYLQQFRPIMTLNVEFYKEPTFAAIELEAFKKILEAYVDKCEIRGV
jgi:pyruvate formate lyase activating enzyme